MPAKKEITLQKGDYKVVFRNGQEKNTIEADVYLKETLVLEWVYDRVPGNNLVGNASIWFEQAILQAQSEQQKNRQPKTT